MATLTWTAGGTGQWNVASNWTPQVVPTSGDTAIIGSGGAIIDGLTIVGEAIVLGGSSSATSVTLTASDATFVGSGSGATELHTVLTVTGAGVHATFNAEGTTSFDGLIFVGAVGGGLTIDVASAGDSFTFDNADGHAVMVVYQESTLTFSGGSIVNDGIIQVEGGLLIASGVDFTLSATTSNQSGQAAILLENGGNATIGGSVGSGEFFDFGDSTGRVTLRSGSTFSGTFGFTPNADHNTIDAEGIAASSMRFVAATDTQPGMLELLDGSSNVLAQYNMVKLDGNFSPLSASQQNLSAGDFLSRSDGHGGTLITYSPDVPQVLVQSLPVTIQATAGTMVPLSSILEQSFGSADPGFYNIILLSGTPYTNSSTDIGYWQPSDIPPQWYVGSSAITSATSVTDISQVYLRVGNQILDPAQFKVEVTSGTTGRLAEDVIYSAWSIDPAVAAGVRNSGIGANELATAAAVVASAETFASLYGLIPNTNLCNWIADNVAAGAGAPMPPANASIDPSNNQPGGFWRIVYTGVGPDPVSDWSTLVQPGDIVRMGWFHPESGVASGHSTTVLGTLTSSGEMLFYDNIASSNGVEVIGIHYNDYWTRTDPADITIYRLDPNGQYLILGTSFSERIQGSVHNDLIQPGGGADTIVTGPGRDEIQGTTAELASITVTDFAAGDSFDFTDLALDQASVAFSGGTLHVASNGTEVATLTVAAPQSGQAYVLAFDGNSGTTVQLGVPVGSGETLTVSSSQSSSGAIVLSGGTEIVLSGGIASGNTVWSGGSVVVSGGATVGDVLSGSGTASALEVVLSGGVASGATVSNAGLLVVSSGGVAAGAVLVSSSVGSGAGNDGVLVVSSGGAASGTQIRVGGQLVELGGVDSDTLILSGGEEIVSSGTAAGAVVFNGGTQTVLSGGTAAQTTVDDGGLAIVSSGGTASGTTVSSGGTLEQAGGATLISTTLRPGATYEIVSGAGLSGFGVTRGVTFQVGTGASATGTTVSSGGSQVVDGGTASATSAYGGAGLSVLSGGVTVGDVLVGSGTTLLVTATVSSGGLVSNTVLSNTAAMFVLSGGEARGTIISNPIGSGGGLLIAGGVASGTIVSSGGREVVTLGTSIATQVKSGGLLNVTDGIDSATVVSNGGVVNVSGGADVGVTVLNGGQEIVSSGGTASGTILSSGGHATLLAGGTASGAQVRNGGVLNVVGGIDSAATISADGVVMVSGGTDVGVTVLSGGVELVLAGGTASASIVSSGGSETLSSGGVTVGTTVLGGGRESVLAGGTASGTVVSSGGLEVISAGGVAQGTVLSANGQEIVSAGGQAIGTVVGGGGSELVSSGGAANGATILNGGSQTALKGGAISGTTVSSGGQEVVSSGGVARGAVVSAGGLEIVLNGGTASGTSILSGASEAVSSGGTATSVTIAGGTQTVLGRGTANGTVVSSGGLEVVLGTAGNTVVRTGGSAVVSSGGTANATVIESGGYQLVMSGGALSGATISGGTLEIASGGGVTSSLITFAGGASGTLQLDDTKFRGKIAGLADANQVIDLRGITFGSATTVAYQGNTLSGTLTVSDGLHVAKLALIGQYTTGDFQMAGDGHGGTLVWDPPVSSGPGLATPH